jgi:indolepyruvate ferredoxin oxidoreductase
MAPPLLARRGPDGRPRKIEFGRWLMPAMKLLAAMKRLRGTPFDVFGRTGERRIERELARDYEVLIGDVIAGLGPESHATALAIAQVPERIRGYGHVKLANIATARTRWRELTDALHATAPAKPHRTVPIAALEDSPR